LSIRAIAFYIKPDRLQASTNRSPSEKIRAIAFYTKIDRLQASTNRSPS
jgi:hypothetical protein